MHDCIWILILWRIKGRGGGVVFDEWWTLTTTISAQFNSYTNGGHIFQILDVWFGKKTTTTKQILNIKLGDQFFFLSKFDLIPCRIFLFSISFIKYVYSKIPSYLLWEKKNLVLSRLTHFFVLRKFFAYFFILYALPLSSLVSIISYQDEIITVYARLYVSKSRNSGPPSSNRPFNENFIQGHFFKKKNYWYQYVCT